MTAIEVVKDIASLTGICITSTDTLGKKLDILYEELKI